MPRTRRPKRPGQQLLTSHDADRAIYLDYEGSRNRPPTLLGVLVEQERSAGIVEPLFHDCAQRRRAAHAVAAGHAILVRELIDRAEREDRCLVSWSEHDFNHVRAALGGDEPRIVILTRRFRNAIYSARRWRRTYHPDTPRDNRLDAFRLLLGRTVPERFGTGMVGNELRRLRPRLENDPLFRNLTPRAAEGWRRIVAHNRYDLDDTRAICVAVARDMEVADNTLPPAGSRSREPLPHRPTPLRPLRPLRFKSS